MELVQYILYTYNITRGENKCIYSSGQTIRIFRLLYRGHSRRCSRRTRSLERPSMIETSNDINSINDILALYIISAMPLARPHTAIVRLKNKYYNHRRTVIRLSPLLVTNHQPPPPPCPRVIFVQLLSCSSPIRFTHTVCGLPPRTTNRRHCPQNIHLYLYICMYVCLYV